MVLISVYAHLLVLIEFHKFPMISETVGIILLHSYPYNLNGKGKVVHLKNIGFSHKAV